MPSDSISQSSPTVPRSVFTDHTNNAERSRTGQASGQAHFTRQFSGAQTGAAAERRFHLCPDATSSRRFPPLARAARQPPAWRLLRAFNPIDLIACAREQSGMHRVIAELETDLPASTRKQLDQFVGVLVQPLSDYLQGEPHQTSEARLAASLHHVWRDGFPVCPPALLERLHFSYRLAARRTGAKLLESPPHHVGRALLALLAEKIAGELCLRIVATMPVPVRDLPQLRRYLDGRPIDDNYFRGAPRLAAAKSGPAIAVLLAELHGLAHAVAGDDPDFQNQLLRQVTAALRQGPYSLDQLGVAPAREFTPRSARDWAVLALYAQGPSAPRYHVHVNVPSRSGNPETLRLPCSQPAPSSTAVSVLGSLWEVVPSLPDFPGAMAIAPHQYQHANVLLQYGARFDLTHGPLAGNLPIAAPPWPDRPVPYSRSKRAFADLETYLEAARTGTSDDADVRAIHNRYVQVGPGPDTYRPAHAPAFASHPFFIAKLARTNSDLDLSAINKEMLEWHQGEMLQDKVTIMFANAGVRPDHTLMVDWTSDLASLPPLAALIDTIRRDGLNAENVSELLTLAKYGTHIMGLGYSERRIVFFWAFHGYQSYRTANSAAALNTELELIRSSTRFFDRQSFGYDRFIQFHQYLVSHAGLSRHDCLSTTLLYLAANGDPVKLANMQATLQKMASYAAPPRAFRSTAADAGHWPASVDAQGLQSDLTKAHFAASVQHMLHTAKLFRSESKFDSPNYVAVTSPEDVVEKLRDLPPGSHLIFQKHNLNAGGTLGHTTALRIVPGAQGQTYYHLYDSNYGEFRFPDQQRFLDFVRHAATRGVVPSFFHFPIGEISAISIVRHADTELARRIGARPPLLQRALSQMMRPFDEMQLVEGYESQLPPYAALLQLPEKIAVREALLPAEIRSALPPNPSGSAERELHAQLHAGPCRRATVAECLPDRLQISDQHGSVLLTISDQALIARYTAYRASLLQSQQIYLLRQHAEAATSLGPSDFDVATSSQQTSLLLQRDTVISAPVQARITMHQLASGSAPLLRFGAISLMPALPAPPVSGALVPVRFGGASGTAGSAGSAGSTISQQLSRTMAQFSFVRNAINSAAEIRFLTQPGLAQDHPDYARYQVATARASVDLVGQSAYVLGWGASRISNLNPAQQAVLARSLSDFITAGSEASEMLHLPAGLKASLARNLALASKQVPGAMRFMRTAASGAGKALSALGRVTSGLNAVLSGVNTALYISELQHTTDPDRYQAVKEKTIFSAIETGLESAAFVAFGTGNIAASSALEAIDMFVRLVDWAVGLAHYVPLENRASLRGVDLALRHMAADYRNPVTWRMEKNVLLLDFNSVDGGSDIGTRRRLNAVNALDLSKLMNGQTRVQAGTAAIAKPVTQEFVLPADRLGIPYRTSYTDPSPTQRERLSVLSDVNEWTAVTTPTNMQEVAVALPGSENDVDLSWYGTSLGGLPALGLNGPFSNFPLRLPDRTYLTHLVPRPHANPAMAITAPPGLKVTFRVPAGKVLSFALNDNICTLYLQPGAVLKITGKMLAGSTIAFDNEDASAMMVLRDEAVKWQGTVLHVGNARIDFAGARAQGPVPLVLRGAQYGLHPKDDDSGASDFPMAGAHIRLSYIDAAKLRKPAGSSSDPSELYGIPAHNVLIALNSLHRAAPTLMTLPVHVLDANNAAIFYDPRRFDIFSPEAAGWPVGSYTLLAQKSVYSGTLWLLMHQNGTVYSMVRDTPPAQRRPLSALPANAVFDEQHTLRITGRPEHYKLPFGLRKIWQAGDNVKLLTDDFLIYSVSFAGTPVLRGAHKNWWQAHFEKFNKMTLHTLRKAFPLHEGWLRLSLPDNGVLHFNPAQKVALLSAPGDESYPMHYRAGDATHLATMFMHRANANGGVDTAAIGLRDTAYQMEDFILGRDGVQVVAGKVGALASQPTQWRTGLPADNSLIMLPGPDQERVLAGVHVSFVTKLLSRRPDLTQAIGPWLAENLLHAALDQQSELADIVVMYSATPIIFHTRQLSFAVHPHGADFIASDEAHGYFYRGDEKILYAVPFQPLTDYKISDLSRLGRMTDVAPPGIPLSLFKAELQELRVNRHSLWLYTMDGRVLELPPGLVNAHRSEFLPPLVRISPHWFDEQVIDAGQSNTIQSRLNDLFARDPAYAADTVLRPDIVAVSLPRDAGVEQDGFYYPQKKQYLAPPTALLHMANPSDASSSFQPADVGVALPTTIWKGADTAEDGANWYYLFQENKWARLGKLQSIETLGPVGDRSLLIMPADDAREITLPLLDQGIQHYLIQRGPQAAAPCTFYLNYRTLPQEKLSIWVRGNGIQLLAQSYQLVVSSQFSLVPGSLQKARDGNGNLIYSADLHTPDQRILQLRFTSMGPIDQVTVARGLNHHERETLILLQEDEN